MVHWTNLNLGMNFNVYGRVFRIADCDDFTKQFYNNEGHALNAAETYPDDPFVHTRAMINMKQTPPDLAEHKNYIEVLLKGGRPNKNLDSFIQNDRKVLSFSSLWEDNSYDGGDKHFTLNFFLADNTVEVKEIQETNSGRYPFPKLLKRQKLSKAPNMTHCPGMSLKTEEFYMPEDLILGNKVNIYGRQCLMYQCDDFTRQWYRANFNHEQKPITLPKARPNLIYNPTPAYNGYGTPEDSMGSVHSLDPKPPKVDMKKMFKGDMHILRFMSKMVSTEPDDESRDFLVSFFCGDDSIQVYEVADKNSGRVGGKFMDRKKHRDPVTGDYYYEKHFLIGATIYLAGFKFKLMQADEYTEKYMEENPDQFPEANCARIIHKIKKGSNNFASMQEYVIKLMAELDKNGDGVISYKEFFDGLRTMQINVTAQEEHAIMRKFDHNKDGVISMEEFYNTLSQN